MPRMTRVRLASLGPPKARIDDLTIPLTDPRGRAADSVIWLRNAGGKSTILALVLALLEPDRRHFLGVRSDHRQRELEDYIAKDDRSLIVAEWELDVEGQLDVGEPPKFLTGVLQERHYGGAGSKPEIRRLFFAGKAIPTVPELTLDGLPYYFEKGGATHRRGRTSFRQEWARLRQQHPEAELSVHENHTEWRERLASVGIDSELFRYQVRMNEKEGGADAVFQFTTVDDFVKMFLELVLRPTAGADVRSNLDKYREKLRRRTNIYMPESTLIGGLLKRMEHVLAVSDQRGELRDKLRLATRELSGLGEHVVLETGRVSGQRSDADAEVERQHRLEREARDRGLGHEQAAARAEHWRLSREIADADGRMNEARERLRRAEHDERVWAAADRLAEARRHESEAQALRHQLEQRLLAYQPLKERVEAAAEAYGAALVAVLEHLDLDLIAREESVRHLDEEISAVRNIEIEQQAIAGGAQEREASALRDRDRARKARVDLEKEGHLQPMQTVEDALATLDGRRREIEQADHEAEVRLAEIDTDLQAVADDLLNLGSQKTRAESERKQLESELMRAEREKERLEQNPLIVRYLGIAEPDLDHLTPGASDQLEEQADRFEVEAVDLHVAKAVDERAIRYLEDVDLLPPSLDVEAVLRVLKEKVQAWAGWHYIARNLPTVEARRALVRRRPEVAAGIIVRDEDVDRVRAIVAQSRPEVEEAVTVVGASVVLDDSSPEQLVIGPSHDARIDKSAGRQERSRRIAVNEDRARQIEESREERRALEELAQKLRDFQGRYGAGWFSGRRSAIRDLLDRESTLERTLSGRRERERDLRLERTGILEASKRRAQENTRLIRSRSRIESFRDQHPEGVEGHERRAALARQELEAARQEARNAAERVGMLRADREDREAARLGVVGQRRDRERELAEIKYLPDRPDARAGDLESLKNGYRNLRAEYEGKVEDAALKSQMDAAERNGQIYRKRFEEDCEKRGIEKLEVSSALDVLGNPALIDEQKEKATFDANSARGAIGRQGQLKSAAENQLAGVTERCRELGIAGTYEDSAEAPASLEEADAWMRAERAAAREQHAKAKEYAEMAEMFDREAGELATRQTMLEKVGERLATLRDSHASLLPAEVSLDGWHPPTSDTELDRRSVSLRETLSNCAETDHTLDRDAERAFRDVQDWLRDERFQSLKSTLIRSLGQHSARTLEEEARDISDQLERRLETIQYEIEHIDRDRDDVVMAVLKEAEEALQMLLSLERYSRLPEDLPYEALRGQHVLRVTTGMPEDPAGRKVRVGDFLDRLIKDERSLPASELVIQAALQLGNSIRVSILAPDPARRERKPITDLAVMSGGERITCATMLYCALARLRARNRGHQGHGTGVLLLDNPVGSASWRSLVDLQRAMARSMGIQLVYLTGVRDYEAVSAMTNIVRLRNGRIDVRTGERIVEFDGLVEGPAQLQQMPATSAGGVSP